MTSPIRSLIGDRIRRYRKARSLTQSQVAEAIGCEVATLSRYERGEFAPDGEQLMKLATLFQISPIDFFPGETEVDRQTARDLRARLIDMAYLIENPAHLAWLIEGAAQFLRKKN